MHLCLQETADGEPLMKCNEHTKSLEPSFHAPLLLLLDLSIVSNLPLGHQNASHLEANASEMALIEDNHDATVQHVLYSPSFPSSLLHYYYYFYFILVLSMFRESYPSVEAGFQGALRLHTYIQTSKKSQKPFTTDI